MTVSRREALLAAGSAALAAGLIAESAGPATAAGAPPPVVPAPPTSYPLTLRHMPLRDPFIVSDEPSGHYYLYVTNAVAMSGVVGVGTMV